MASTGRAGTPGRVRVVRHVAVIGEPTREVDLPAQMPVVRAVVNVAIRAGNIPRCVTDVVRVAARPRVARGRVGMAEVARSVRAAPGGLVPRRNIGSRRVVARQVVARGVAGVRIGSLVQRPGKDIPLVLRRSRLVLDHRTVVGTRVVHVRPRRGRVGAVVGVAVGAHEGRPACVEVGVVGQRQGAQPRVVRARRRRLLVVAGVAGQRRRRVVPGRPGGAAPLSLVAARRAGVGAGCAAAGVYPIGNARCERHRAVVVRSRGGGAVVQAAVVRVALVAVRVIAVNAVGVGRVAAACGRNRVAVAADDGAAD